MSNIPTEVNVVPRKENVFVEIESPVQTIEVLSSPRQEPSFVEPKFSTRPIQRSAPVRHIQASVPTELQDIARMTDTLSSNIVSSNDDISDPNVMIESSESAISLQNNTQTIQDFNTIPEPVQSKQPEINNNQEPKPLDTYSNLILLKDEDDDESVELSFFTETKQPVEEHKEEPIIEEKPVEKEQPIIQEQPVKPTVKVEQTEDKIQVKQVAAKPVQVEDDPLDIGITTEGKEEIKPVSINIEDMFIPFDSSTEKTIHTEKERTEIVIPNMNDDELIEMVRNITRTRISNDQEAKEILLKKNSDLTSYESRVNRSILFDTPRRKVEEDAFKDAVNKNDEIVHSKKIEDVTYKDAKSGKSQLKRLENGAIIDAKNSLPMTMALLGGIKKIHFYNSGFWVIVRPPLISELHTYFTRCQQETVVYGRQFGQLSFLPADVEISKAGLDLFKSCIDSSNLIGCKDGDTFERCLAVSDERTYLWGLASLMYPEGTEIEYVCSNKDCHYIDRVLVDLSKMRYFDYTRLGLDALKYCHSSEQRTEEDIKNYKENIFKSSKTYELDKQWSLTISEPSLFDQLEFKSDFIEDISATLELNQFDKIDEFITARYFRLLSPWVKRVAYTNETDGKRIYLSDERSAIIDVVDALQLRYSNLPEIINEHIKNTQASYFCYSYNACPKCGNIPTTEIEGLIPCDIQQSFFSLTVEKLK